MYLSDGYGLEDYLITTPRKVVDKPKQNIDKERPNKPISMVGLRPTLSES